MGNEVKMCIKAYFGLSRNELIKLFLFLTFLLLPPNELDFFGAPFGLVK